MGCASEQGVALPGDDGLQVQLAESDGVGYAVVDDDLRGHLAEHADDLPSGDHQGAPSAYEGGVLAGLERVIDAGLAEDGLSPGLDLGERDLGRGGHGAEAELGEPVPDHVSDLEDPLRQVAVLVVPEDPDETGGQVSPEAGVVLGDRVEDAHDIDLRESGDLELLPLVAQGEGVDLGEPETDEDVSQRLGERCLRKQGAGGLGDGVRTSEPLETVSGGDVLVDVHVVHDV